jgi:hypothetical protein
MLSEPPPPPDCTATVALCVAGLVPLAPVQVSVKVVVLLKAPVLALPLVGSLPDHPPVALQLVALLDDQVRVEAPPAVRVAGLADRLTVGLADTEGSTAMLKGASELELTPSLTLSTMLE